MAKHVLITAGMIRRRDWVAGVACIVVTALFAVVLYLTHESSLDGESPLRLPGWWESLYVEQGMIGTLFEIIPATVVAVFIFAAGSVFVIAQLINGTLGSRAVLSLLNNDGLRAAVIWGMMLLVFSLAVTTVASIPTDPQKPLPVWLQSASGALAVATVVYILFAMLVLVGAVWTFVDPRRYSESLSQPRKSSGIRLANDLHERQRTLRQWLRTASANGESRDLLFALDGLSNLLEWYVDHSADHESIRSSVPRDYTADHGSTNKVGWFADEVGRTIVRSVENGIQSGRLLRRDAERMLERLVWLCLVTARIATRKASHANGVSTKRKPNTLPEETGYLIDRVAEIGMFCSQVPDQRWRPFFERSANWLADLNRDLERLEPPVEVSGPVRSESHYNQTSLVSFRSNTLVSLRRRGESGQQTHELSIRALAGWCLVNAEFDDSGSNNPLVGAARLGEKARAEAGQETAPRWTEASGVASIESVRPRWSKHAEADQGKMQAVIDLLRKRVAMQA